jgi:hypothetical protein
MSASPAILAQAETAPRFSVKQVAKIKGLDPSAIRHEIATDPRLIESGIITLDRENGRGQKKLLISAAFHPLLRIAAENPDVYAMPDLSRYSAKQRNATYLRRLACDRLRTAMNCPPATIGMSQIKTTVVGRMREEFPDFKITVKSLERWLRRYQSPRDLEKLVDTRGGDCRSQGCPEVWKFAIDLKLSHTDPSIIDVFKAARQFAVDNNLDWCSLHSFERQLKKRISPAVLARHCHPKEYRNSFAPWIEQDPEKYFAGECWHSDWKLLDVICSHNGTLVRPWCCCWLDVRSRKVTGHYVTANPDSHGVRIALHGGVTDESNFGGPDRVHLDNGADFASFQFIGETKKQRRLRMKDHAEPLEDAGLYHLAGITATFAQKYNPQGKSRLERLFRNFESVCKTFPTYTGQGTDHKPESLNENLKSAPTMGAVAAAIAAHIREWNESSDHQIDHLEGLSPMEFLSQRCPRVKKMADPSVWERICRQWFPPTHVGRNGVPVKWEGRTFHFGQFEPALIEFKGRLKKDRPQVRVSIDPENPSVAYVHRMDYRFVCQVAANQAAFDREGLKRAMREKRLYDRAVRVKRHYEYTEILTPEQHARDASIRTRQEHERRDDPPRSLKIQTTPLDGQGKYLERQKLRQAVGAECANEDRDCGPSMLEMLRRNVMFRDHSGPIGVRDPREVLEELSHGR